MKTLIAILFALFLSIPIQVLAVDFTISLTDEEVTILEYAGRDGHENADPNAVMTPQEVFETIVRKYINYLRPASVVDNAKAEIDALPLTDEQKARLKSQIRKGGK